MGDIAQDEKQEDLRGMINKFSERFYDDLEEFVLLTKKIYTGDFRHSYSDITALLIKLNSDNKDAFNHISINLSGLIDKFTEKGNEETLKSLNKLYDHITLEQIRLCQVYQESKELIEKSRGLIDHYEQSVGRMEKTTSSAEAAIEVAIEVKEEASKLKVEVITVLGIFAAIVMAFTGGIAFSTSVLENMHKTSIYRIIMVLLAIGLVLVNGIYVLTEFIRSVTKVGNKDSQFIFKLNLILFLAFVITCIAMKNHWLSQEVFHVVEFVSTK